MSQPTRTPNRPANHPGLSPAILRRLSHAASHDFDVIGDAPPPAEEIAQPQPKAAPAPAATRAAE